MKNWLKFAPAASAVLGGLAALLRLWLNDCVDEKGLYFGGLLPRALLWVVTLTAAALITLVCLFMRGGKKYGSGFPASAFAGVGMGIGGVCIGVSSVAALLRGGDVLNMLAAAAGLVAAAALLLMGLSRYQGARPNMLLPGAVCVFLILRLLDGFRVWSPSPQAEEYLFMLLASVALMLASYQTAAFCYGRGSRKYQAMTHLAALFFCIGALPGCADPLFYLGAAAWMGTNVCALRRKA